MDEPQIQMPVEPGPRAAAQRQTGFRLLRFFSIASLAAIARTQFVLAVLYQRLAVRDFIEAHNIHHVAPRVVENVLGPRFSSFIASSAGFDATMYYARLVGKNSYKPASEA